MSQYAEQIEIEAQKIALYKTKIEQCQKRIESLKFLMTDSEDALDSLTSNMIGAASKLPATDTSSQRIKSLETLPNKQESTRKPGKSLSQKAIAILKFIGIDGKTLSQIIEYANLINLGMTDGNIRNFAMIYRKDFGYLENPQRGFYRLTEKGLDAISRD